MGSRNQINDLTIREIEYSIQIKDKDKGFHDLHEILRSELTRFEETRKKKENTENPIREFLRTNIERSIVIRDSTRVYFLDYREQGSFIIHFKLLVISRYTNYGSIRQAIDYLIKDTIGDYFEELLERHLPASVTVHSADTELYDIPGYGNEIKHEQPGSKREILAVLLAALALFFTLIIGLIWVFQKNPASEIKRPTDEYRDKYFELLIDKQINDAINKEKLNLILYKNVAVSPDTGLNLKYQPKK